MSSCEASPRGASPRGAGSGPRVVNTDRPWMREGRVGGMIRRSDSGGREWPVCRSRQARTDAPHRAARRHRGKPPALETAGVEEPAGAWHTDSELADGREQQARPWTAASSGRRISLLDGRRRRRINVPAAAVPAPSTRKTICFVGCGAAGPRRDGHTATGRASGAGDRRTRPTLISRPVDGSRRAPAGHRIPESPGR